MINRKKNRTTPSDKLQFHLHYLDQFMRVKEYEQKQSQNRIQFFLALVGGTIALFPLMSNFDFIKNNKNYFWLSLSIVLFVLLIYGLLVFASIIWSRRNVEKHEQLMAISKNEIINLNSKLSVYSDKSNKMSDDNVFLKHFKGTWVQFMYLTETLLSFCFIMTIIKYFDWQQSWQELSDYCCYLIIALFISLFVALGLYFWSKKTRKNISNYF